MAWVDVSRICFEEKMLWLFVLRRSIFDYVLYKGVRKHRLTWQRAHRFIFLHEVHEAGLNFDQICGLFGWDSEYMRRKVKELDRSKVKKLEAMKFKDVFDESSSTILDQHGRWHTGQSVPMFAPINYSVLYRSQMKLQVIFEREPEIPKPAEFRLGSFCPIGVSWS